MTQVGRTDIDRILGNMEDRIRALERAPAKQIYIDDRIITSPTPVVTFDAFPSNLEILELTWEIATATYVCMVFSGDYPVTENDYRWRLFGNTTNDNDSDLVIGNSAAVIGWAGEPLGFSLMWGRIRFPNYNDDGITLNDQLIVWQGEGGFTFGSPPPDTWLISGAGDRLTPLTEINVFATDGAGSRVDIVNPSRLTLTCY